MKKEDLETSKINDLSDTMFKIIEDVSQTEENIENILNEINTLKESISHNATSMQNLKQSQDEMLQKINNNNNNDMSKISAKVIKLEENINKLLGSGMLEELSKNIDNKVILKKQITKWQMFMVGILVFLAFDSVFFFIFIANATMHNTILIAFFISVLPFIIAMAFVQNNVKNLIAQEKAIPNYRRITPRPTTSQRISSNIKDTDEVKNTFE